MGKRVFFWNRIYCGKERFRMKGDSMGLEELISYLTTSEEIEALWPFATVICLLIMQFLVKRDKDLATRHAVDSKSEGLGLGLETEEDDSDIDDEEALEPWDAETEEDSSCPSAAAEKIIHDVRIHRDKLKALNKRIKDKYVSDELDQMDFILHRIIGRAKNAPSTVFYLHRLLEYYLPTVEKLLTSYDELDCQSLRGENIIVAKREIKRSLKELNRALENMLNNMFQDEALDVSTDVSVMLTMLKQDGLLDEEIYTRDKQEESKEDSRVLKAATPLENIDGKVVYDAAEFCDNIFDN